MEENQDSDKGDTALKEIVPLRFGKPQGQIVQIKEEKEALELLFQMGRSVFQGERLERFVQENLRSLSQLEEIPPENLLDPQGKNLKLFGLRSGEGEFLGGLVVKFFPWERLKDQLFFSPRISQDGTIEELSVQSISSLVEKNFKIPKKINLGIYLSFFAVHEVHRKKGLGRDLFERYIKEVEENPQEGKLAFTIILGKHSFFPLGETLMQNMLGKKPRRSTEERDFQELKTLYHLPEDLFQTDSRSAATKALVKERGFTFLGFSKFLGELWGKIF